MTNLANAAPHWLLRGESWEMAALKKVQVLFRV